MEYDLTLAKQAYELAERWDASRAMDDTSRLDFKDSDLEEFNTNQISMSHKAINLPYTHHHGSRLPPAPSNLCPAPFGTLHTPQ
jgi:hypothetical protein